MEDPDSSSVVSTTTTTTDVKKSAAISDVTLRSIETRALSAEKRLQHMTALLSESESEAARLTQMTDLLKEEIRSYQRSEERKKHIENLEYVKNIILKVSRPSLLKSCRGPGISLKMALVPPRKVFSK